MQWIIGPFIFFALGTWTLWDEIAARYLKCNICTAQFSEVDIISELALAWSSGAERLGTACRHSCAHSIQQSPYIILPLQPATTCVNEKGTYHPNMRPRWYRPSCFLVALTYLVLPSGALWPFDAFLPKRFRGNALLGAGSLGVDDDGRIVAFGDFNGDQLCVPKAVCGVA